MSNTLDCEHGFATRKGCPMCRRADALKPPTETPITPYAGTSGWSGSDTSKARAKREDADGTTSERQKAVLVALRYSKIAGLTWREVADYLGVHHGAASGVLSVLHKEGHIERLSTQRDRMKIYVLPEYVNGRPTEPHGRPPKPCSNCGHIEEAS